MRRMDILTIPSLLIQNMAYLVNSSLIILSNVCDL